MKKLLIFSLVMLLLLSTSQAVVPGLFLTFGQQLIVSNMKPAGQLMELKDLTQQIASLSTGSTSQIAGSMALNLIGDDVLKQAVGEKAASVISQISSFKETLPEDTKEATWKVSLDGKVDSFTLEDVPTAEGKTSVEGKNMQEMKLDKATGNMMYTVDDKGYLSIKTTINGKEETLIFQNLKKGSKIELGKDNTIENMDVQAESSTMIKIGDQSLQLSPGDSLQYSKKDNTIKVSSEKGFDYCPQTKECDASKKQGSYNIIGKDITLKSSGGRTLIEGKDFQVNDYKVLGEGKVETVKEGLVLKEGEVEKTGIKKFKVRAIGDEGLLLKDGNSFSPNFKNQVVFDKDRARLKGMIDVKDGLYVSDSYGAEAELFYKDNNVKMKAIGEGTVRVRTADGKENLYMMSEAGKHTVKKGETLSKIAAEKGVSIEDILRANPQIKDKNKIMPGQELAIPAAMLVQSRRESLDSKQEGGEGAKSVDTKQVDGRKATVKEDWTEIEAGTTPEKKPGKVDNSGQQTPKTTRKYYDDAVLKGEAPMNDKIEMIADREGLTPDEANELKAIIAAESKYNPAYLVSYKRDSKGKFVLDDKGNKILESLGYAQVNKITLDEFNNKRRKSYTLDDMKNDPDKNIEVSAWYWKYLKQRYNGDTTMALLAYNRGPTGALKVPVGKRATDPYVMEVMHYYSLFSTQGS